MSIGNTASFTTSIYVADLLSDKEQYNMLASSSKGRHYPVDVAKQMAESMTADGGTIDQLFELFSEVLNVDAVSANALSYACNMTKAIFDISQVGSNNGDKNNNKVKDQSYLQEMLKNGMMFISSIGDDAYYYQENYSTNTFIKEKSDDSYIAQAEAKYTNQKARLTSKEDELDLKMKNLDTEISSLTTEYDSVKSVIDKNIEKSFKRYDA